MKYVAQQARSPTPVHTLVEFATGKIGTAAGDASAIDFSQYLHMLNDNIHTTVYIVRDSFSRSLQDSITALTISECVLHST